MKTIHIPDTLHKSLRLKAIHQNKKLNEVVNEILSSHFNKTTTSTKEH